MFREKTGTGSRRLEPRVRNVFVDVFVDVFVGKNPFEVSANDVLISVIGRTIGINLAELNNEPASEIPDPLRELHCVQM